MSNNHQGKSSLGNIDGNIAGLLCYALTWISGLIFFLTEKENKFVKFHAAQSLILFAGLQVVIIIARVIPFVGGIIVSLVGFFNVIFWIVGMYKAYTNEYFKFPIVGDMAESFM